MAKGTRYTPEFKAKAVRLLESLRRWRNQSDATVAEETRQSAEDAMAELRRLQVENAESRRANEILTTASAFFAAGLDPTRR